MGVWLMGALLIEIEGLEAAARNRPLWSAREPKREPMMADFPELARLPQESESRSTSSFLYIREPKRIGRRSPTGYCECTTVA